MWNRSRKRRQRQNPSQVQYPIHPPHLRPLQPPNANPSPPKGPATPDLIEYVVGIRGFTGVYLNHPYLNHPPHPPYLVSSRGYWQKGKNEALCQTHDWTQPHLIQSFYVQTTGSLPTNTIAPTNPIRNHIAPEQDCGCGFYVYHDFACMANGIYGPLWAVVQGWGKVQSHRDGFRCQYARIVAMLDNSFLLNSDQAQKIQQAAKAFDIPVIPIKHKWRSGYQFVDHQITNGGWAGFSILDHPKRIISRQQLSKYLTMPDLSEFGLTIPKELRPEVYEMGG